MSNSSIKIDTRTKIKIDGKDAVVVKPNTNIPVQDKEANKVLVSPRTYSIVSPDIYTIKRNSELPPWFQDQINNMINGSSLSTNVTDLENRFENFQDGVTLEIGYLKDKDNALAYDISTLKTKTDNSNAAIQRLDIVKTTEEQATTIASTVLGAWQAGEGGAWFDEKLSTTKNLVEANARSASTLAAVMESQQSQLNKLVGDINVLEKQIDGKVETWKGYVAPVLGDGSIDPSVPPYSDWIANGEDLALHTGDTYLYLEVDPVTGKDKLLVTYRFAHDTDTDTFNWYVFKDDLASVAYQEALDAGVLADSKIVTYYQTFPPTTGSYGDLWLDSDDNNKMYRYSDKTVDDDPTKWVEVSDSRIEASVKRLDDATVDVNGVATAKSSLVVDAGGNISGFRASSTNDPNDPGSVFKIFADKFIVSETVTGNNAQAPFRIENGQIYFNGRVSFNNVDDSGNLVTQNDIAGTNGTVIDGSAIKTGTVSADRLVVDTVWVNGSIRSQNFSTIGGSGFRLKSNAAGSYDDPNIYGAYIRGSDIHGGTLTGVSVDASSDVTAPTLFADKLFIRAASNPSNYNRFYSNCGIIRAYGTIDYRSPSGSITLVGGAYGSGYNPKRLCSSTSTILCTLSGHTSGAVDASGSDNTYYTDVGVRLYYKGSIKYDSGTSSSRDRNIGATVNIIGDPNVSTSEVKVVLYASRYDAGPGYGDVSVIVSIIN